VPWPPVELVAEELAAEGIPLPTERPKRSGRYGRTAPYALPPNGKLSADTLAQRQTGGMPSHWDQERIIEKLREFDRELPSGKNRSQGEYRRLLPDRPDWPAVGTVIARGGWKANVDEAKRRNSAT
jgi:hypothetical protein